jgi:hypothetical protein
MKNEDHGAGLIHQTIPDVAETDPRLSNERATRIAELRRLQREIREWSVSQMIWPTMTEVLTLIDHRCDQLKGNQVNPPPPSSDVGGLAKKGI